MSRRSTLRDSCKYVALSRFRRKKPKDLQFVIYEHSKVLQRAVPRQSSQIRAAKVPKK